MDSPPRAPSRTTAACTRAAQAHATAGAAWADAIHHTLRSLIDRLATSRGLPPPGLPRPTLPAAENALDELDPLTGRHINDLGEIHQLLLELTPVTRPDGSVHATRPNQGRRNTQGAWYTPPETSTAACRLALTPQLDRLAADPHPGAILDLTVIDPACGAGVILVAAAHLIADRLATRTTGHKPPPHAHTRAALPTVMRECIFGTDIDPVAVDLTKTALWLETNGREPFSFMDRNVITANPLNNELPPAFTQRHTSHNHTGAPTP